ncbi:MAG TPA: beta-ketoacyl-ACP synthase III [Pirellulaceae bacterium]|nr:beta-ketoacyl-ACP synthase III [Pirellulaceae bacterium]
MDTVSSAPAVIEHWTHPARARLSWKASLLGYGSALPNNVVRNDYFVDELKLDTTAQWIQERTGIRERRHAPGDMQASDLACQAARVALERAQLDATELDLIVIATSTPDFTMPSTACLVQQRLGAQRAMAFDISNACAGFVYAADLGARYLQTGVDKALVIGVDLGSRLVNFADRGTCIFFGDAAGAVVLGASGTGRVLASKMYSSGDSAPLSVPVGGSMYMDGKAIWKFATRVLPSTIRALCEEAQVPVSAIKLLVPHQANRNIIAHCAEELGLPIERVAINIEQYGNTLAASVPLALDEALAAGRASKGDIVALAGFGAGLAWGGMLLEL